MRKLIGLMLLALTVFCMQIVAQQKVRMTPMPVINIVNLKANEQRVRISEVKTDVKVVGTIAITTVDMIFYNPNNRVLEGELQFPLGDGQSISRFALDINGKLREGVVVDKAIGQEAFETVIRQKIDPGLLEKTQGNNFKTRVYPLPAKGTRRVVIAYEQELQNSDNGFRFHLPVEYGNTLDKFSLNVSVFATPDKPKVDETPWGKFSFDRAGDAYVASYQTTDYEAKGQIVFSIPDKSKQRLFVEKGKISGDHYFYAAVQPQIKTEGLVVSKPSKIALYWDASSSMEGRDLENELNFLDHYFREQKEIRVYLYTFNCVVQKPQNYLIHNGNWSRLKEELKMIKYDGATQYGALDLNLSKAPIKDKFGKADDNKVLKRVKSLNEVDEIFLFSDGLSNFGNVSPVLGNTPVNVVSSLLSSDQSMLKYIAGSTGGKYINLMQHTPAEAISFINKPEMYFLYADYDKNDVSDISPSVAQPIMTNTIFSVTGRLKSENAHITLNFGIGSKVLYSETIDIRKSDAADYDNIVERISAEKKIEELDIRYDENKTEIENLGRRFNIVTRNTSLIVLDRVEDYVRYEIAPPSELLAEYNRQLNLINKNKATYRKDKTESVIKMLDERKEWWSTSFPKGCFQKDKKRKGDRDMVLFNAPVVVEDEAAFMSMDEVAMDHNILREEVVVASGMARRTDSDMAASKMIVNRPSGSDNRIQQEVKATIALKNWSPDTPYMKILKSKSTEDIYRVYLDIKEGYKTTPSFYLDVATLLEEKEQREEALIVLSNLAELEVENFRLLRVLGHRLNQLAYKEYAIKTFEKVLKLRPNEPQSYRDLGSVLAANGEYQRAVETLYEIVLKSWDGRFPQIEVIAVEEMNKVISEAQSKGIKLDLSSIDDRLIYKMPVDIRIVLNWDTDNSDMDLWVTDPCGEVCIYSNPRTRIGGLLSSDFTGGYGPEEFMIKEAVPGTYKIQANYFGSREQTLIGPTTIYLDIYTYYSSGKEKKETITMRLTENKEIIDIGEITFERR